MKSLLYIFILIFVGLIPLLDLLHPGLPITHDGQDHVARIVNFYQNLADGNIIPRWAPNLNWGYGHPILMFLYPLPSYIASLFHFLGFSLVDSVKLVFGTTLILSGLTMYLWVKNFLSIEAGFIAGVLYMLAPYRFVDLYVRGAIGEHVAFVFMPLILYFIFKLSKKYSPLLLAGGAFSVAGLLLSHNAISIIFFPVLTLYAIFLIFINRGRKSLISRYIGILVLGLGISAFFWIPAFFEGKYTLRNIVTAGEYASRFVQFQNLIYGNWNYGIGGQFSVQVGIVHWLSALLSFPLSFYLYKKKNKLWILTTGFTFIFLITLFLMNQASNFIWERITILQKLQFPWRFLSVTVLAASVLGGLSISVISNKKIKLFVMFLLLISVLFLNKDYWHANGFLLKPESFYKGIYNSTTDTGESSPIWSVRFMLERPKTSIEVISGKAVVKEIDRKVTMHSYQVEALSSIQLRENTLYFPGWKVLVDGKPVNIEFQDENNRGVMTFWVDAGKHRVDVVFEETKLRLFSNLISTASLVLLLGYNVWGIKLWRRFL